MTPASKVVLVAKKTEYFSGNSVSPEHEEKLRRCEEIIDGAIEEEFRKQSESGACTSAFHARKPKVPRSVSRNFFRTSMSAKILGSGT